MNAPLSESDEGIVQHPREIARRDAAAREQAVRALDDSFVRLTRPMGPHRWTGPKKPAGGRCLGIGFHRLPCHGVTGWTRQELHERRAG